MYPYEKDSTPHKRISAHFRFRSRPSSAAATLFDSIEADTASIPQVPTLSSLHIAPPNISAFIAAHHRRGQDETLNEQEAQRAVNAADRILALLSDGEWHDMPSIVRASEVFGAPQRLRSLRKLVVTIDGTTWHLHIERRRSAPRSSVWEYRAQLDLTPQPLPTKKR